MKFALSDEQVIIETAARDTKDNILVSALAGAAKTTTLKVVAKALPKASIICLAFNKSIAAELSAALPANCRALTLHSLGNTVWKQYLNLRRTNLQNGKMFSIVKDLIDELSGKDKTEAYEEFAFILRSCNEAKSAGHLPDKFLSNVPKAPTPIIDDAELLDSLDEKVSGFTKSLILRALNINAEQAMQGIIDFTDMVLFPSLFKCMYPPNNLVLVDEAQDLSPLNHRMLQQLVRKRIIAVGDQCQAIYGFRGAHEDGMSAIRKTFDMIELHLSCSFRCPQEIVEHVQWRAPSMTAWDQTPSGSVTPPAFFHLSDIPDGAAIICRNNAPILRIALALLGAGRYPNIWGNDIARSLIKQLEDLGPMNMDQADSLTALRAYYDKQAARVKSTKKLDDTVACLEALIRSEETLGGVIARTKQVFSEQGPIDLMTGHKSKGSEFDTVYFLDSELVTTEGQDPNLRYVICTRSKHSLTYINSEECLDLLTDEERAGLGG